MYALLDGVIMQSLIIVSLVSLVVSLSATSTIAQVESATPDESDALSNARELMKLRLSDAMSAHGLDRSNPFQPASKQQVAQQILARIEAGVHPEILASDGSVVATARTEANALEWLSGAKIQSPEVRGAVREFFRQRAHRREVGMKAICENALDDERSDAEFIASMIDFEKVETDFVSDYSALKSILPGNVLSGLNQREQEFARGVHEAEKTEQMHGFYQEVPDIIRANERQRCRANRAFGS